MKIYLAKFAVRISIVLIFLVLYLTNREGIAEMMMQPFSHGITFVLVIWFIFMGIMISHLIPNRRLSMAWKKSRESEFHPVENYDKAELAQFIRKQNIAALLIMLVWLAFNAIFGILYLKGILIPSDLLMLTVFFFLCDYICILLFCPFQTFFM
ncbi:MAG: hypothetical protein IKY77_06135, partial [Methanocorpusculaceae archaeon]|nr:hypothetical protein [Methanocorpusculaceae archaeon]